MNELENLKVGDLVIVCGSYSGDCLREVERVTKSQIVVGGTHYWKKNGLLVGGGHWYGYIRRATEKDIEFFNKVKQKNELLTFIIRKVPWRNLSLESLQTICDVVKKEIGNSVAKQ